LYRKNVAGAARIDRAGAELDKIASENIRMLHHRRMPGARAAIDHIVITPGAVWVLDMRTVPGKPQLRVEGGVATPRVEKLVVGGRDQTHLLDAVQAQIDRIETRLPDLAVRGAVCFVDGAPLLGAPFSVRGVDVVWPGKLGKLLRSTAVGRIEVAEATARLARAFPPA
jgi:hypothetical protein